MSIKLRTPVRLPKSLANTLQARLTSTEEYGPRKKSLWVSEALEALLHIGVVEIVALHLEVEGVGHDEGTVPAEIYLNDDVRAEINATIIQLTKMNPFVKWDMSLFIRGAIRQRLKMEDGSMPLNSLSREGEI
jgi:hypothetical protein